MNRKTTVKCGEKRKVKGKRTKKKKGKGFQGKELKMEKKRK